MFANPSQGLDAKKRQAKALMLSAAYLMQKYKK